MADILNTRSPYYIKFDTSNITWESANLDIYIYNGILKSASGTANRRYRLSKKIATGENYVVFEIAELVRDYIDIKFTNGIYNNTSVPGGSTYAEDNYNVVWVYWECTMLTELGSTVDYDMGLLKAYDGYCEFEEGLKGTNNLLVFPGGQDTIAPWTSQNATTSFVTDTLVRNTDLGEFNTGIKTTSTTDTGSSFIKQVQKCNVNHGQYFTMSAFVKKDFSNASPFFGFMIKDPVTGDFIRQWFNYNTQEIGNTYQADYSVSTAGIWPVEKTIVATTNNYLYATVTVKIPNLSATSLYEFRCESYRSNANYRGRNGDEWEWWGMRVEQRQYLYSKEQPVVLQSNNTIWHYPGNYLNLPVNTAEAKSIEFYNDDILLKTLTFTGSDLSHKQISYGSTLGMEGVDNQVTDYASWVESKYGIAHTFYNEDLDVSPVTKIVVNSVTSVITSDSTRSSLGIGQGRAFSVKNLTDCRYEPKKVVFVNKFGALQDLYFFRKSIVTNTMTSETYNRAVLDNDRFTYDVSIHNKETYNVNASRKVVMNTGYLDEEINKPIEELMLSEQVWLFEDGVVKPLIPLTKSLVRKTRVNDKLINYTIEFEVAYNVINNVR